MVYERLLAAIRGQLGLNRRKNLLHDGAAQGLDIEPTFLAALEEARNAAGSAFDEEKLSRLASFAADSLIDGMYAVNQYLQVGQSSRRDLRRIYVETWRELLESGDLEGTIRTYHYPILAKWAGAHYPHELRAALAGRPGIGGVACGEYSVGFQLRLFGLDPRTMIQPVMDIGCGAGAGLVEYLLRRGIEAHGVDRSLKKNGPSLRRRDWLETDFEPGKWGTMISHMAFSNHFTYVERFEPERLSVYIGKFLEMLSSLKPGGAFFYAPSAGTLEGTAEENDFEVVRRPIGNGYFFASISRKGRRGGGGDQFDTIDRSRASD